MCGKELSKRWKWSERRYRVKFTDSGAYLRALKRSRLLYLFSQCCQCKIVNFSIQTVSKRFMRFLAFLTFCIPLHCFRDRAVDEALSDSRLIQSFFFCLKTVEVIAISAVLCNLLMPLIAVKRTPFWLSVIFPALFVYPDFLNGINAKVTARNTLWIT